MGFRLDSTSCGVSQGKFNQSMMSDLGDCFWLCGILLAAAGSHDAMSVHPVVDSINHLWSVYSQVFSIS